MTLKPPVGTPAEGDSITEVQGNLRVRGVGLSTFYGSAKFNDLNGSQRLYVVNAAGQDVFNINTNTGDIEAVNGADLNGFSDFYSTRKWKIDGATGFFDQAEVSSDPANPAANTARLFARDNGSGKTQLCVRFPTGAAIVLATEL